MRSRKMIIMAIMALICAGCARRAEQAVDDVAVSTKVKAKLAGDTETSAIMIGVSTANGVVTLSGEVPTEQEKAKAEQLARGTEGVTQVVNNITINPNAIGASNIKEKTEGAVSDAAILSKIKSKLLLEQITGTDVDVENGEVTLKGEVSDKKQITQAAEIARSTNGVKSVNNQLTLKRDR
ncbi:MAG: BON domain-containing protein [Blastocatellia bacterium]|nr:BON domain-containing protein [Blastocatellia bacterium]